MERKSALDQLLEPGALTAVFQPIVSLTDREHRAISYEALTRGIPGTNLHAADVLFEYVRRKRAEKDIDRLCVALGIREAARLPGNPGLHVNVHALTLANDPSFPDFVAKEAALSGIDIEDIVIEIVEHSPASNDQRFHRALRQLRELGAAIGLDDVGLGQSNFKMILDIAPDYLKIDRYFVAGSSEDRRRRIVLRSIAHLAREFGAATVAEGIEEPRDLDVVVGMGIPFGQGYLFGKPKPVSEILPQTTAVPALKLAAS